MNLIAAAAPEQCRRSIPRSYDPGYVADLSYTTHSIVADNDDDGFQSIRQRIANNGCLSS